MTLVPPLLALGLWQLQRGEEKAQRLVAMSNAELLHRLPSQLAPTPQRVQLEGRLDDSRYFLLDNRTHRGRAGYEVVAVAQIVGESDQLLVNLGWVAAPASRALLPELSLPHSPLALQGWLVSAEPGFQLSAATGETTATEASWPRRVQQPDWQWMADQLGVTLYPGMLRLAQRLVPGIEPIWQPVSMPPAKHYGYALQWFGLALMSALWLAWWARREEQAAEERQA